MSELTPRRNQDPQQIRADIAELAAIKLGWIEGAARQIGGEHARVEDVFPLPPAIRDEAPAPDWNEEQEAAARTVGERLGYASENDIPSGKRGSVAILDGGLDWKMRSETMALRHEVTKIIIVSGSADRKLIPAEKAFRIAERDRHLKNDFTLSQSQRDRQLAIFAQAQDEFTEYDIACEIADSLAYTGPVLGESRVLSYGYQVSEGNPFVRDGENDQIVQHGRAINEALVLSMRVDRENYTDENGQPKYRFQPSPLRRLGIVANMLDVMPMALDVRYAPVVLMTSNAYAEYQTDALRASLEHNREFAVNMYGRSTLAKVKKEEMLPGARLNQLPGALRIMYEGLRKLRAEALASQP